MDERGHRASAMRVPVVDDFLTIEVNAGAATCAGSEAIVAIDGPHEFAGPAHRIISRRESGSGRDIVPFEIDGKTYAIQNRSTGQLRDHETLSVQAGRSIGAAAPKISASTGDDRGPRDRRAG